jgi:hypothetical protein
MLQRRPEEGNLLMITTHIWQPNMSAPDRSLVPRQPGVPSTTTPPLRRIERTTEIQPTTTSLAKKEIPFVCRIGWHRWTRWVSMALTERTYQGRQLVTLIRSSRRVRTCLACDLTQERG